MGGDIHGVLGFTEAASLAADLIKRLEKGFPGPGGWKAAEQIITAAESISANVAEGYGRGFGADGARFLRYARASAAELEGHLTVAVRAGRFNAKEGADFLARIRRVRALINGLIKRFLRDDNAA